MLFLNAMLKWLYDNRNQLFIGILVFIIGSIILAFITEYILNRKILNVFFVDRVTLPSYIITTSVVIIMILYLLVVTLWKSNKSSISSLEKNLKHIQFPAKLGTLERGGVIFTFETKFMFNPEHQYNPSDFADKIYLSEHYVCDEPDCKSVLIMSYDYSNTHIICPNNKEHFDMDMGNEFFVLSHRVEGFFKGIVMKDFDKYWNIYKNELSRATGGKPEEYDLSWNKHKMISKSNSFLD